MVTTTNSLKETDSPHLTHQLSRLKLLLLIPSCHLLRSWQTLPLLKYIHVPSQLISSSPMLQAPHPLLQLYREQQTRSNQQHPHLRQQQQQAAVQVLPLNLPYQVSMSRMPGCTGIPTGRFRVHSARQTSWTGLREDSFPLTYLSGMPATPKQTSSPWRLRSRYGLQLHHLALQGRSLSTACQLPLSQPHLHSRLLLSSNPPGALRLAISSNSSSHILRRISTELTHSPQQAQTPLHTWVPTVPAVQGWTN